MLELTVSKQMVPTQELLTDLSKYGLSYDDYMLAVVGSASEAGRVLQQFSRIRNLKGPEGAALADAAARRAKEERFLQRAIMRIENVRRGGLVSQIATAARNLQSAIIRAPLEGLGNVMDTALMNLSEKGIGCLLYTSPSPRD